MSSQSRSRPPEPPSSGKGSARRRATRVALAAGLVIVIAAGIFLFRDRIPFPGRAGLPAEATFVGRARCIECHPGEYAKWFGSDHDKAMAEASDSTVLGDFNDVVFEHDGIVSRFYKKDGKFFVRTEGPGGEMGDFEIAYTFGVEPLQQYLVPFPGGRLQSLTIAWDVGRKAWFSLYPGQDIPPGDWLHWTRGGQNWNGMCAACHSTNLEKGYDPESGTFHTTWSEIDVSCEACHGPGSRHVAWAGFSPRARRRMRDRGLVVATSGIDGPTQVALCAPCHSRRAQLGDYDHAAASLLDQFVPSLLQEGLYFADGQILDEVYVYGSFLQSKMYAQGVKCGNCHDVHSLKLLKDGNDLCLQCHKADVYDTPAHHFHHKTVNGSPSDGASCVKCHMPERPYMVIDWRADHSMRVPRPDLTAEIGAPNACAHSGCHDDKPVAWAVEHFREWYGDTPKPHYGRAIQAGRNGSPGAARDLVEIVKNPVVPAIVRATALSLLGLYERADVADAFAMAMRDGDPLVRYAAVYSVNAHDAVEMVMRVAPLLFDSSKAVRARAAARLAGVKAELLTPDEYEALKSGLSEYKREMSYSLDFPDAGRSLGDLYAALGEPEKADAYYREAITIDGLFYPAKMRLAVLDSRLGKNDEAESLLREVIRDYPNVTSADYLLGLLLAEMKRYDESVRFMEKAAAGMPDVPRVHYNFGLALQRVERDREAEAEMSKALVLDPTNRDYLLALADHYIKRGAGEKAKPYVDRLIAAYPDDRLGYDLKKMIEGD